MGGKGVIQYRRLQNVCPEKQNPGSDCSQIVVSLTTENNIGSSI